MQLKKHLVMASYVDDSMLKLDQDAKSAGIIILGEMSLDPGIGNLHLRKLDVLQLLFFVRVSDKVVLS